MSLHKTIKKAVNKVERQNENRTKKYKERLEKQIKDNILVKKQSKAQNQVLIDRFYGAKPMPLTAMQQAMKEAVQ